MSSEPETVLALPNSTLASGKFKTVTTLSDLYDKQLVGTIDWAKQIPGFTDMSLKDQMKLLQASWSEVMTLSLVFRSLPTSVAAANVAAKEAANGLKRKLKFAPDFALTEDMAMDCGLEDFYQHVNT